MIAFFGSTDKPRNSTKVPSSTVSEQILLKDDTSVVSPYITLKTDADPTEWNFCHIPALHRYYYIVDMVSLNAHMWGLQLEVDVLATYRKEIKETEAFVQYSESAYNTMIPDTRLQISDKCENIAYRQDFDEYASTGLYALSVATYSTGGDAGMATVYLLSASNMAQLSQKLSDRSFISEVAESFADPLGMVLSCVWMPLKMPAGANSAEIRLGDFGTGVSASYINYTSRTGNFFVDVELPYKAQLPDGSYTYADFRNVEPYTQYTLQLPGIGVFELPVSSLIEAGAEKPKIAVSYTIDYSTGDIVYRLRLLGNEPFMIVNGNLAVPVPIFNSNYNVSGALTSIIGSATSLGKSVAGIATGSNFMAISGAFGTFSNIIDAALKMNQSIYTISGKLGGKAGAPDIHDVTLMVRPYSLSDSPSLIAKSIGRPLFANKLLGDLSGYVKCSGAHVKAPCTNEEHIMLSNFLEASANYTYGGVIIE